jgi:hypothetical protein
VALLLERLRAETQRRGRSLWVLPLGAVGQSHQRPPFLYNHLRQRFPQRSAERERRWVASLQRQLLPEGAAAATPAAEAQNPERAVAVAFSRRANRLRRRGRRRPLPLPLAHHDGLALRWEAPEGLLAAPRNLLLYGSQLRRWRRRFSPAAATGLRHLPAAEATAAAAVAAASVMAAPGGTTAGKPRGNQGTAGTKGARGSAESPKAPATPAATGKLRLPPLGLWVRSRQPAAAPRLRRLWRWYPATGRRGRRLRRPERRHRRWLRRGEYRRRRLLAQRRQRLETSWERWQLQQLRQQQRRRQLQQPPLENPAAGETGPPLWRRWWTEVGRRLAQNLGRQPLPAPLRRRSRRHRRPAKALGRRPRRKTAAVRKLSRRSALAARRRRRRPAAARRKPAAEGLRWASSPAHSRNRRRSRPAGRRRQRSALQRRRGRRRRRHRLRHPHPRLAAPEDLKLRSRRWLTLERRRPAPMGFWSDQLKRSSHRWRRLGPAVLPPPLPRTTGRQLGRRRQLAEERRLKRQLERRLRRWQQRRASTPLQLRRPLPRRWPATLARLRWRAAARTAARRRRPVGRCGGRYRAAAAAAPAGERLTLRQRHPQPLPNRRRRPRRSGLRRRLGSRPQRRRRSGGLVPTVHYRLLELELLPLVVEGEEEEPEAAERLLLLERKYGRVGSAALLADLFGLLTPALRLVATVAGHGSRRRTVYAVRAGAPLEQRRRLLYGWLRDLVAKNPDFNHLRRNTLRKPASKKVRTKPERSRRLTVSFRPRLAAELRRLLAGDDPLLERLEDFDAKAAPLRPTRRHYRWDS